MKKILSLLLAGLLVFSYVVPAVAAGDVENNGVMVFVDVTTNFWAKNEIESFASEGIVNGKGDGKFEPQAGVTREEFAKMLVKTFRAPLENPEAPTFTDVDPGRWSYPYIEVSKDFLTGYVSPFDGSMTFKPGVYATREDIAVALVRMMGLTEKDAKDPRYAASYFSDGKSISPNLLPYVSIACERNLINGYEDGTFAPSKGITRAEAVVLLSRASKQAVVDGNQELEISTNVVYNKTGNEATIYIATPEGCKVTVDGKPVRMDSEEEGNKNIYTGAYLYKFEEEGSKIFTITATKNGKTSSISVTAKYELSAPKLIIAECPASSTNKTVTIRGTVTDKKSVPTLSINGETVYVSHDGTWSHQVKLIEGQNKLVFTATNAVGKVTTEERVVTLNVSGPQLNILDCPATSSSKTITVRGTVSDSNYKVSLTVNGENVYVSYDGTWSHEIKLNEGQNKLIFTATTTAGKTTVQERMIVFNVSGPQLNILMCPSVSSSKTATIQGTVLDSNYTVSLTINGETVYVSYDGTFNYQAKLNEGENKFVFSAVNTAGKTVTQEKVIVFNVGNPDLLFLNCPETTEQKSISLQGKVTGVNEEAKLFVNDQEVYLSMDGSFQKSVELKEGENVFVFRAVNGYGKSITITKTIVYTVASGNKE